MQPKVSELVAKINWITSQSSFPNVSKLEFDLVMHYVRDLYEELDSLRNPIPAEKNTVKVSEPIQAVIQTPPVTKPAEEKIKETEVTIKDVPLKKESIAATEEPIVVKPEVKSKASAKASINEIVLSSESLNSRLKATSKEIHHKLSSKPLKELIDLNKRFVIINDLFGGSAEDFGKAVQQIDSSDDFETAETFIRSNFINGKQWNDSSQTAQLFWSLVRQRFGSQQ